MNRDLEEEKLWYMYHTPSTPTLQFKSLERATSLLSHRCTLFGGDMSLNKVDQASVIRVPTAVRETSWGRSRWRARSCSSRDQNTNSPRRHQGGCTVSWHA